MANQSIYSDKWIDLVFENRNKAYGAYQLRHENPKTTLKALSIGFLFITLAVSIPFFMNKFGTKPVEIITEIPPITLVESSSIVFPPEKKPETQILAPLTKKEIDKPETEIKKEDLVDPKVTEAKNAKTEINTNEEAQQSTSKPEDGAIIGNENSGVKDGTGNLLESNASEITSKEDGTHVTRVLDKQPSFPGGMNKFYSYIAQNFKTPETEISKEVKVYVSFVIEKDGTMTDIKVPRNPGFGLDKEAIRVLTQLKIKWSPGILNGKPVRTSYNLPIVVKQN